MANWKKISIVGAIILAAGVGTAAYLKSRQQPPPPVPVPQQTPAEKDLVLQGRAYCSVTLPVTTPIPAKVVEVLVTVGQPVVPEQPLLRMELLPEDAAKMVARANKGSLIQVQETLIRKAELEMAQLDRDILEATKLTEVNLAPKNALPLLLEQKSLRERQLQDARSTLADLKLTTSEDLRALSEVLGYPIVPGSTPRTMILRAKQPGIIIGIEPNVSPGVLVTGKVMTMGVMNPMRIRGQVHESEVGRLQTGDNATITLDSGDQSAPPMVATLSSIAWMAQDSNLSAPAYYLFELSVPNPDLVIRDGSKVRVTFKAKPAAPPAPPPSAAPPPTSAVPPATK